MKANQASGHDDLRRNSKGITAPFLPSIIDGNGRMSDSCLARITPAIDSGWVGHRSGPEAVEKEEFSCPCEESHPDSSVVQPLARHYNDWPTEALFVSILCI
jgi:hypothetical protein